MMQVQKPKQGYKIVQTNLRHFEEIPIDWNVKRLSEISDIVGGGTPDSTKKEYWDGNIQWAVPTDIANLSGNFIIKTERTITDLGLEESSAKLLPPNSILITSRATIGECAMNLVPMSTNQGFQNLVSNSMNNNLFIFYSIKFHKNMMLRLAYGTTFLEISKSSMNKIKIPVPKSFKEQQKIASILSNIDSLILQIQNEIEQTRIIKKGLMQRFLTKGIGHTKFKKVKFLYGKYEEIPEDWNIYTIRDFTLSHKQGFYTDQSYVTGSGTKLVRITDLQSPKISYNSMPLLSLSEKIIEQFSVLMGDILFARTGAAIGTFGIVTENIPCVFASYLIRFRFDSKLILNEFFGFAYAAHYVMKQQNMIRQGSSNININAENIKSIKIILPPISEQQKIATILSNFDYQIDRQKEYKSNLENLKKGLMQKLLTGQIRVKV